LRNGTWSSVPSHASANVVTGSGYLGRNLTPMSPWPSTQHNGTVHGFTQKEGIDYGETFSPVVKPAAVDVVLSLATSSFWHVPITSQFADIFTKGLPTVLFQEFRSSLNILPGDALAAGDVEYLVPL
jgi:hypothetical protein